VLDAKGRQTNFQYNIDNTLNNVSYTNAAGSPLSPATPMVSFTYDTAYVRPLTMVDGVGTTQYAYNAVGAPPALGAGRLASVAGPWANSTIAYTYDALGRVVSRSINGAVNMASATYDSLGRATAATNVLGTFGYSYVDATARLAQTTYPTGQTAQFQYFGNTGDQRLQEIKNLDNSGNLISQFDYAYNAVGDITTWTQNYPTLPNPRQFAFGYDAADQLTSGPLTDTVTSAVLSDQAYRYDAAGNRVTTQNSAALVTEQPNALNQITQTSAGGTMRFAGSVNTGSSGMGGGVSQASVTVGGNPATVNPDYTFVGFAQVKPNATTRVHNVASNVAGQVTDNYVDITPNIPTQSVFAYDLNGNTTSAGPAGAPTATYGWDAADRLVTITQGSNVTKFDYDGEGRRVREWLNGTELRRWVWCGLELCEERDASNNVTKRFYGQGEQIAGSSYYFTRDHLGSIREMTDASNVLRARYDYDLYGQATANSVTANPVASDFGFTGRYYHASSGLYLAPYRAYNASVGRWLSRDPIGEDGGINLYAYVGNRPVNGVDPLGLEIIFPAGYDPTPLYNFIKQSPNGQPLLDFFNKKGGPDVHVKFNERLDPSADSFHPMVKNGAISGGVINWNPHAYCYFGSFGNVSAGSGFTHELLHAWHANTDLAAWKARTLTPTQNNTSNAEEDLTMSQINDGFNGAWNEPNRTSHSATMRDDRVSY